jgi:hypothetical protein
MCLRGLVEVGVLARGFCQHAKRETRWPDWEVEVLVRALHASKEDTNKSASDKDHLIILLESFDQLGDKTISRPSHGSKYPGVCNSNAIVIVKLWSRWLQYEGIQLNHSIRKTKRQTMQPPQASPKTLSRHHTLLCRITETDSILVVFLGISTV